MKFPKQDLIEIIHDDQDETRYEIVEEGEWVAEHKFECRDIIFKFEGKFYQIMVDRSGSYYTDWYYSYEDWDNEVDCLEVEPITVTVTKWRVKK